MTLTSSKSYNKNIKTHIPGTIILFKKIQMCNNHQDFRVTTEHCDRKESDNTEFRRKYRKLVQQASGDPPQ